MQPLKERHVQIEQVPEGFTGQRLDNYLIKILKGVPKGLIYRLIRKGAIKVNGKRSKVHDRVSAGDQLSIPPLRQTLPKEAISVTPQMRQALTSAIVYEDENLLVMNKPAGMAVHAGSGVSVGLIDLLRAMRPSDPFLELVHRLDRETSGCLLIAKKRSVLNELHEAFRQGAVTKEYIALTKGRWPKTVNRVDVSLEKNKTVAKERVTAVEAQGKSALSEFHVLKDFGFASLMKVKLFTGRTHQIRVHAQYAEHPIAGDEKYGDKDFNKTMRQKGCKRLFLHAQYVTLRLEGYEHSLKFNAPLDPVLENFLDLLKA
ncbi:MAG: RluA family pseudouridine synthase [Gammaproteobacteria bacterium]|nr:RluA family pseudouridine synthase [Gammaproteobacteria bacterium]MBU1927155.1 RluA family pseudouridine synthase [Gammaproteobacteria bacterium]MBU2546233.1 RluA family pseudouridine synthase [Gammaproteobacteria bacterium]